MFLSFVILALITPLMLAVKEVRLRKVMLIYMATLLVFTFSTERFGSYIPMGAVLIGLPALVLSAASTLMVHFMTRERWFYLSLLAAILLNVVVLYIFQFMLATPCTPNFPNCGYHTIAFDTGILAAFSLFAYAHWLGWLRDGVHAVAPVKVSKRNARRAQKKTRIEVVVDHLETLNRPIRPVHHQD